MSEILSQSEIDDLLGALNSGTIDAEQVKNSNESGEKVIKEYNFARPSKFSKEQLRTIEMVFENYIRLLVTNFTVLFRSPVSAEILSVEAIAYQEFINSLPVPTILGLVDFYPLKGSILLEISNNIGYSIIDRLLGGDGNTKTSTKKEFSEIEIAILERIMARCSDMLKDPWESVVDLSPDLERIETNPQYAQLISHNEMVALVTIELTIGEVQGMFNICVPYMVIEPIMDKLNTKYWFSNMQKDESTYGETIEKNIRPTHLDCKAVLGETNITVYDFMNLQVGDVLRLNKNIQSSMDLYIGKNLKYKGKVGTSSKSMALLIEEVVREEEHSDG